MSRRCRFDGKVVVVTGAASGIGQATARQIEVEGGCVVRVDRDRQVLDAPPGTGSGLALVADVGSVPEVTALRDRVVREHGRVDAVINSAGILRWGGTAETSDGDWEEVIRVNLTGSWLVARAFAMTMVRQRCGSIVLIASNMAVRGSGSQIAYSASKGGILALTRSMAVDLGPSNVRVNCVNPGHVVTPMSDTATARLGLTEEGIREKYPLGRVGRAAEVASAIAYLASDEASFVTGAIVAVDGGNTA